MLSLNFRKRKAQVVGLIVFSLWVANLLQWDEGLWVAVSVTAIIGPFSPSLTLQKSRSRIIGTIAGLLLATILEIFLRYNHQLVFIIGFLLAYCLGFTVQQNYRYFIMVVTIAICLNFEYLNLPFTSFEPISFLISRFMAVLAGITLFLFIQKYILGPQNARNELAESTQKLANHISDALGQIAQASHESAKMGIDLAMDLSSQSESFKELLAASDYGLDAPCNELNQARKIDRLKQRVTSLLLDYSYAEQDRSGAQSQNILKLQKRASRLSKILNQPNQNQVLNA